MNYGYIRVSTDKQDVENQKVGVVAKAHDLGLTIDEYITDDGVSGTKEPEDRKLGKLLKKINRDDVIITSELSRLGRSLFMVMRILEHCMKVGAKVYTVKDNYELGDNIQSKVLAFAFSLAAEIERNMISERTKEALRRKKSNGMILGRPIGRTNYDGGNKICRQKHGKIVALFSQRVSISAIARIVKVHRLTLSTYLKDEGIYTPSKNLKKPLLEPFQGRIKELISEGKLYQEIHKTVNKENNLTVSAATYRSFIAKDEVLYNVLTGVQNNIRIKANGGLRVNKRNL